MLCYICTHLLHLLRYMYSKLAVLHTKVHDMYMYYACSTQYQQQYAYQFNNTLKKIKYIYF